MALPPHAEITQVLRRAEAGDASASEAVFEIVRGELHRLADRMMRGQSAQHTLQATALVHEVWMRLLAVDTSATSDPEHWRDRLHFMRTAARAMRSVLVDHARKKATQKRDGGERLPLDEVLLAYEARSLDVVAVHEALARLEHTDTELARVVEIRFFAGLTIAETAEVLGISTPTVERRWRTARAWLYLELSSDDSDRI